MDEDTTAGRSLLLAFDTDDEQFARGFELGRAWALLQEHPDTPIGVRLRADSAEMAIRLGEALGRVASAEEIEGYDRLEVLFSAAEGTAEPVRYI